MRRAGGHHGRSPAPLARCLALVLPLLLVLGVAATPAVAPAHAAPQTETPTGQVSVVLDQLLPGVPAPGDVLAVSGSLINHGLTDLRTVSVRLRLSPTPVVSRTEIGRIANGRVMREGSILWHTQTTPVPLLPAGAAMPFRIEVPIDTLPLPAVNGVAVLAVEALGDRIVGDGIGAEPVGLTTTFLPWFPDPAQARPVPTVWLWPLTTLPARDSTGTHRGDALADALAPGGRLRTLLDLAAGTHVPLALLLDPALLETVRDMADGYVVRENGTTRPGTGAPVAGQWLRDLRALLDRPGVVPVATAYAMPDIVALHRVDRDIDVTRAVTDAADRVADVIDRPVRTTMPWPADGVIDAGSVEVLAAAGAPTVLLSDRVLPTDNGSATTADGVAPLGPGSGLTAVLADHRLAATLAQADAQQPETALLTRQRLLADLAEISVEPSRRAPTVVLAPPPLWDPDRATVQAWFATLGTSPYLRAAPLAELLDLPAANAARPGRSLAEFRRAWRRQALPRSYLHHVVERRDELAAFRAITSNDTDARVDAIDDGLSRTESLLWRGDLAGGRDLLDAVGDDLADLVSQVRVVSHGSTTFPGEEGVVPVVIANDLDQPVRVGLRVSGTPAIRFSARPHEPVTVPPHTKASVEVKAKVVGSGDVNVRVQLTTVDGAAYGPPAALVVRSTAYARAAGWAVGGLLALLVVLLAVNFVRRRRPRPPAAPAGTPSAAPPGTPAGSDPARDPVRP